MIKKNKGNIMKNNNINKIKIFGNSFTPKENYDQHFMTDDKIIRRIIKEADIKKNDSVLEIGPGNGALTKLLIDRKADVTAVEIDPDLAYLLKKNFRSDNFKLINSDAIGYIRKNPHSFNKIISNLPYMISEPLMMLLPMTRTETCILTISKTFSDKLTEDIESRKASMVTFYSRAFFNVENICDVPKESFIPKPRKGSSVVKIKPLKMNNYKGKKLNFILRELFLRKTKKLKNALRESLINYENNFGEGIITKRTARNIIKKLDLGRLEDVIIKDMKSEDMHYLISKLSSNAAPYLRMPPD